MTEPTSQARELVDDWTERWPQAIQFLMADATDDLRVLVDRALQARERALLHEVNRVFCGGLASSLDLQFMKTMSDALARQDAERATWRAASEVARHYAVYGDGSTNADLFDAGWKSCAEAIAAALAQRAGGV